MSEQEPLTSWWCDGCGKSGVIDARGCGVYEAVERLETAHRLASKECADERGLRRVSVKTLTAPKVAK